MPKRTPDLTPSGRRDWTNAVVVVTAGGNGIGAALARRFAAAGARVTVLDRDEDAAGRVAQEIGGVACPVDVTDESALREALRATLAREGRIDLCASNAGVQAVGGPEASDAAWEAAWAVNVLSQVYAARELLPHFLERQSGTFLQTASAGGLLVEVGSAAYTATKAAVIGLAEWLSIKYRRKGIAVSVLCPAGVQTDFLNNGDPAHSFLQTHAIEADAVAAAAFAGLAENRFLIVPEEHEQLLDFFGEKARDYDRYLHLFSRVSEKIDRRRERSDA